MIIAERSVYSLPSSAVRKLLSLALAASLCLLQSSWVTEEREEREGGWRGREPVAQNTGTLRLEEVLWREGKMVVRDLWSRCNSAL